MFNDFWVVVAEQPVKHTAGAEGELVLRLEIAARQEQCAFIGSALAAGEQELELVSVKPEEHQAHAEGHVKIRVVLREFEHVRHEHKARGGKDKKRDVAHKF